MSPKELEAWLERLHEESFGWALNCSGGDAARAEDVLQTAYVRVISGRAIYAQRSSFRTWLFGVIRRVAQEENRRTRKERQRTVMIEAAIALGVADEPARSPDQLESSNVLREALGQLPQRQREVLHLVFYQDLSIADAADVMEISVGSARTHYERGKARLRLFLGERKHERPATGS
ncbi:MAG TPA: RNA polymerase sigma factor [Longimicrobiales bacterium]|nr:RNA polymerase sigma factor [Longimicrobiales bacterium]